MQLNKATLLLCSAVLFFVFMVDLKQETCKQAEQSGGHCIFCRAVVRRASLLHIDV